MKPKEMKRLNKRIEANAFITPVSSVTPAKRTSTERNQAKRVARKMRRK